MEQSVGKNKPLDELSDYRYEVARQDGMTTIDERCACQQPQCAFGTLGVRCTLCTDGPCQITRKADRGVCGASADLIAARNPLFECAQGTVANCYRARNVARTLKAAGEGQADYTIKEPEKSRAGEPLRHRWRSHHRQGGALFFVLFPPAPR